MNDNVKVWATLFSLLVFLLAGIGLLVSAAVISELVYDFSMRQFYTSPVIGRFFGISVAVFYIYVYVAVSLIARRKS